jgi:putative flippase GtrA
MSSSTWRPQNILVRQLGQYAVVGGLAFVIDFALLVVLTEKIGFHYLISASIAFIFGLVVNYVLCVTWVFDHRAVSNRLHEFGIFSAIGVLGLVANDLVMFLMTDVGGINYRLSKIAAAAMILLLNFSLRRNILFIARS